MFSPLLPLFLLVPSVLSGGDLCSNTIDREVEVEKCLIMIKPDAVARGLAGEIILRLETKGFKMVAMKLVKAEKKVLEEHYQEHAERPFFPTLVDFMQSGPVLPMVWEGNNIVKIARGMLGATDPLDSLPGTIRGDMGLSKQMNLCHVSDSTEAAKREITLWFDESELISWKDDLSHWKQ